jgi:cytochrome c553
MGLYLFDAAGNRELLYRDPEIGCECPLPVQARPTPPVLSDALKWGQSNEGRFVVADVYRGLKNTPRGTIKALRIVAVPPKTHPTMDFPNMGVMRDDPGKCVLGTVPVEEDGSAHFRVPASLIVFFQALDARGMAVQTMRGVTYVQPGQTASCTGCHESRHQAPPAQRVRAAQRESSRITPGPEGSWPLRFDRLVQPVLDQHCVRCHNPKAEDAAGARFDLSKDKAYETLVGYGAPSLRQRVQTGYSRGASVEGDCGAQTSPVLKKILEPPGHFGVSLDADAIERLATWLDTYGQRLGSFSEEQERDLVALRGRCADLLAARPSN